MRLTKYFWQTYKEKPADAVVISHIYMSRAGLVLKEAAGLYQYLPMGLRVIKKIENLVRKEMEKIDCQELSMSVVTPGELWKETDRWDKMEGLMLKFKDQGARDLCISPTNEEAITDIFRKTIKSYKQLPVSLFQINTKFRDEIRPRFGLMRGREFTMKDAYAFCIDQTSMDKIYDDMYQAYENILKKLNLKFVAVEADAGAMGNSDSRTHEFHILADSGEDDLIFCDQTKYAANIEKAQTKRHFTQFAQTENALEKISTPNISSIEDVCTFLKIPKFHSIKSLLFTAVIKSKSIDFLILILGDDQLNEVKLKNYLSADELIASTSDILKNYSLIAGFIGPIHIQDKNENKIRLIIDNEVDLSSSFITGANEKGFHFKNFIPKRDLDQEYEIVDLRMSKKGDLTFDGKGVVDVKKGIEAGHIFQLGKKYTEVMGATILDQFGKRVAPLMGCFGMGITRIAAASIEQNHDDKGIKWPKEIAPFQVHFILIGKSLEIKSKGEEIYQFLNNHFETLYDDRKEGAGYKFKDADLLGCPIIVALGEKNFNSEGVLELTNRQTGEKFKVTPENLVNKIKEIWKILK